MSDAPLVSLCLPTYGRAACLRRALEAVRDAAAAWDATRQVELCVSDNASPDDTAAVIETFRRDTPALCVRHYRQAENVGFSKNLASALALATGRAVCFLGDDDRLTAAGLRAALDAALAGDRLTVFNSLPGGDAIDWRMRLPDRPVTIADRSDLLRTLGVFHLSFMTNAVMDRAAAVAALEPRFLRSRYPHLAVAWRLLDRGPATYVPLPLVDLELSDGTDDQPLLTSVDMARLLTEVGLPGVPRRVVWRSYAFTVRLLPRAVLHAKQGRSHADAGNPFASLTLGNVVGCYRRSMAFQAAAATLWAAARLLPQAWLRGLVRAVSRRA